MERVRLTSIRPAVSCRIRRQCRIRGSVELGGSQEEGIKTVTTRESISGMDLLQRFYVLPH